MKKDDAEDKTIRKEFNSGLLDSLRRDDAERAKMRGETPAVLVHKRRGLWAWILRTLRGE